MSIEQMLKEEAELEKQMFGNPSDPSKEASKEIIPNVDTFEPDTDQENEIITVPEVQENKDDDADKKRNSWKQRFIGYKTATDRTISNLRKELSFNTNKLAEQDAEIRKLKSELTSAKSAKRDIFEGVISQAEIDTLGVEAIDVIKKTNAKAAEAIIGPMQEEINRLKAKELNDLKEAAKSRRAKEYAEFTRDLSKLVPDYKALDVDPDFAKFMSEVDPSTGNQRLDEFRRAEDYLDYSRVADFFLEFKASIPKSKKEVLEDKVTPTGSNSQSTPISSKQDTFTIGQVNKFFDDVTKGVYRNRAKEADEIEARITKAYMAGNIKG